MSDSMHPYQRLQIELAELIEKTPPGERLLSEPMLAQQLHVSRATLREAMRAFEGQGLIRRRQGIGTFVVGRATVIESGLEVLQSIETMADSINLKVTMGALHINQIESDEKLANGLKVEVNTPLIKVERVILGDNRPVAFLVDILPENVLTPAELEVGFNGSVLDLLLQRGSPNLLKSYTEINAVAAPTDIARALEIQRGDVLLMFQAYLYDDLGRAVNFSKSYFIPGYFRFHVVRKVGPMAVSRSDD
ncbi:MAG: GntR family transcriptional regulator [Bellilinea sp.]